MSSAICVADAPARKVDSDLVAALRMPAQPRGKAWRQSRHEAIDVRSSR
jgi:hypothetical protein